MSYVSLLCNIDVNTVFLVHRVIDCGYLLSLSGLVVPSVKMWVSSRCIFFISLSVFSKCLVSAQPVRDAMCTVHHNKDDCLGCSLFPNFVIPFSSVLSQGLPLYVCWPNFSSSYPFTMSLNLNLGLPWCLFPQLSWEYNNWLRSLLWSTLSTWPSHLGFFVISCSRILMLVT